MMKIAKLTNLLALQICTSALVATPAHASGVPVFDAAVVAAVNAVNASVVAMNTSVTELLFNIGLAINQNGQKVSSTIEASSKAQRDFDTVQQTNRRLEDARQRYAIPSNICAESASGGAIQVTGYATTSSSGMRPGGGAPIGNRGISQAINSPTPIQGIDAARSAKIHAQFCDTDDYAAYGGAQVCPSVSAQMPGADKRFDSLNAGAGPAGKKPDLTFSQEQTDAARIYVQNSVRRSIGGQLRKVEAETAAGTQYVGLMNQYNAIVSAAADPQEQRIAESQPNPVTRDLIKEALLSPSANAYYALVASPHAKASGTMSAREFEQFEVGRRYANTVYQSDLQAMAGDNLTRELIRVTTLSNWLTLSLKNEVQKGNMINGLTLSSLARQEFEPILTQKYGSIPGRPTH